MCSDPHIRIQCFLQERMPEEIDAHRTPNLCTVFPEQAFPAKRPHVLQQFGLARGDDRAALVEHGEGIAHPAALACRTASRALRLRFDRDMVRVIECRLRLRIGKPHQHIEQIMPSAFANLHRAIAVDARLVGVLPRLGRDQMQRRSAGRHDSGCGNQPLQHFARRPLATMAQRRSVLAQGGEQRRAIEKIGVPLHGDP